MCHPPSACGKVAHVALDVKERACAKRLTFHTPVQAGKKGMHGRCAPGVRFTSKDMSHMTHWNHVSTSCLRGPRVSQLRQAAPLQLGSGLIHLDLGIG